MKQQIFLEKLAMWVDSAEIKSIAIKGSSLVVVKNTGTAEYTAEIKQDFSIDDVIYLGNDITFYSRNDITFYLGSMHDFDSYVKARKKDKEYEPIVPSYTKDALIKLSKNKIVQRWIKSNINILQ